MEGSRLFDDYVRALGWAQEFARTNRSLLLDQVLAALRGCQQLSDFDVSSAAVNCHHNYVQREKHFGRELWITRNGAVRAGDGELGLIPGSMGTRSYIVCGRGNPQSFCSCSHGAGRAISRTKARKTLSVAEHHAELYPPRGAFLMGSFGLTSSVGLGPRCRSGPDLGSR